MNNPAPSATVFANLQTSCAVYRRHLVIRAGPWNDAVLFTDEWEWTARLLIAAPKAFYIPVVHTVMRFVARNRMNAQQRTPDFFISMIYAINSVSNSVLKGGGEKQDAALAVLASIYLKNVRHSILYGHPNVSRMIIRSFLKNKNVIARSRRIVQLKFKFWWLMSWMPARLMSPALKRIADRRYQKSKHRSGLQS